jgi:hypothetical protein
MTSFEHSITPSVFDSRDLFLDLETSLGTSSTSSAASAQSTYESPLLAVIQDIRRQNVAAAAAGPPPPLWVDPWEMAGSLEDSLLTAESLGMRNTASITARNNMSRRPHRASSLSSNYLRSSDLSSSSHHQTSNDRRASLPQITGETDYNPPTPTSTVNAWDALQEPQHARALLQSTPQFQMLCHESTDMDGAGHAASRNIFTPSWWQAKLATATNTSNTTLYGMDKKHHSTHNSTTATTTMMGSSTNSTTSAGTSATTHAANAFAEYRESCARIRAHKRAAVELASLLWTLAHEMSLEDFGAVEAEVFTRIFSLVHTPTTNTMSVIDSKDRRMAGLTALDYLLDAPSADEEKKAIKFANTLSKGLSAAHGEYEFLSAVSQALGHMATRTTNVDFVESEVTRALEWLRTDRSDRRYVIYNHYIATIVLVLLTLLPLSTS